MRRTSRLLIGTALAVTGAGSLAAPAYGADGGRLAVVPSTAVPGGDVTVDTAVCGDGGTAEGDATAVGAGHFTLAPGAHEGQATGRFRVPSSAQPGTYEIVARCTGGGPEVRGDLVVVLESARGYVHPRGSVRTGVGGALGTDPVQTAAGVAALAVAGAGGTWLLHRRARGDGI
ncbi:hypothetical protein [Streptomyces cinereospinus]|uniref:Integral membrane protein n=1 Tax=Streptomyces cinereospinus TaxID=285561 RepID=A0ABV5N9B3_9ACTN